MARLEASGGISFVQIPPGSFVMGSNNRGHGLTGFEAPSHVVTISKAYYLSEALISVSQYYSFVSETEYDGREEADENYEFGMRSQPANEADDWLPARCVSWLNAVAYCNYLSRVTGRECHLPTEAQWEYACCLGLESPISKTPTKTELANYCHFGNSGGRPRDVRLGATDRIGLRDMLGNVSQWCADWFERYDPAAAIDPAGPSDGAVRRIPNKVIRGASFNQVPKYISAAARFDLPISMTLPVVGFRVAATSD